MTDIELDILDELYFPISFDALKDTLGIEDDVLLKELQGLVKKGWVQCIIPESDEIIPITETSFNNLRQYHYLATKEGLLAHNSK
ncbi:hypothetical protein RCC89_15265 [Cytophagaceae bacterium ABcell3]|nr:hypothetical protein RCC89_15265 [Cytophagaceae bacterium ABcell3]